MGREGKGFINKLLFSRDIAYVAIPLILVKDEVKYDSILDLLTFSWNYGKKCRQSCGDLTTLLTPVKVEVKCGKHLD